MELYVVECDWRLELLLVYRKIHSVWGSDLQGRKWWDVGANMISGVLLEMVYSGLIPSSVWYRLCILVVSFHSCAAAHIVSC